MQELDNFTLMMAIQAVNSKIHRYEQLLSNTMLNEKEEVRNLLDSYQKALTKLKRAYIKAQSNEATPVITPLIAVNK